MHVKLIVNSFPTTSETFLFNLVVGLEQRNIKVTVCANSLSNDIDLYKARMNEWSGNLDVVPLRFGRPDHSLKAISCILKAPTSWRKAVKVFGLKKGTSNFIKSYYLQKGRPDIIHFAFSGIAINYLDAIEHTNCKSQFVVSCRGSAEKVKPITDPQRRLQLERLFRIFDKVHCVSKDMMHGLVPLGLDVSKVFINYPSINTTMFEAEHSRRTMNAHSWYIVSTGRLHFQKGYVFALQAMRILKEKGIRFSYHILGEGKDREMILYVIHEMGLHDFVYLHGRVNSTEVFGHLRKADVFLLPSLYEGVSNAALEAMATELPVLTTRAGGMAEVIAHGINGLLTDWKTPGHMAEQLIWLYENQEAGAEMGKNARATVKELFSSDRQIEIFINQYNTMINVN